MHISKLQKLVGATAYLVFLSLLPLQAHAAMKSKVDSEKEKLVLMPLRVPDEDRNLTGAMETALLEGLQQKYDVFSGEQVSQKAREIFLKETRNTAHKECDETKCMQNIAMAFQAELLATANVTKQNGSYFLALKIENIFDNKAVYSKSTTCKNCDATEVVDKLKELSGMVAPVTLTVPVAEESQPKINFNDSETALWEEVKKGNTEDDYQAYLREFPNGKYVALANSKLKRLKDEAQGAIAKQDQQAWSTAQQTNSQDGYASYINQYPQGQFTALARGRIEKIKRELVTADAKRQQEQAAEAERQKKEAAALPKGFVSQGGLTWALSKFSKTWSEADEYCNGTAINGQIGWRLPTKDELKALFDSGSLKNQSGAMNSIWSSTQNGSGGHYYGGILVGIVSAIADTAHYNVWCAR